MIEELVVGYIGQQMDELAKQIEADYKAEVANHKYTPGASGAALGAIHIEKRSEYSYFIGAKVGSDHTDGGLHLYYLDEGNGGKGTRIYPKHARALGKHPDGIPGIGWRKSVRGYSGFHITTKVASKYR